MAGIIVSDTNSLPRDIDVSVQVSKPQAETATDFSTLCFVTKEGDFDFGAGRVRYYSSLQAVQADFEPNSETVKSATCFFSQSPRAKTFAVGRVFDAPQSAFLHGGKIADKSLEEWQAVTDGGFTITINGNKGVVAGVNFSGISSVDDIAGIVQTALRTAGEGAEFTSSTVKLIDGQLIVTSGTPGEESTIAKATEATGTFIGGEGYLNIAEVAGSELQPAYVVPGYTPGDLASELGHVQQASRANGRYLYGWTFDKSFRDTEDLLKASAWVEAQTAGICGLCTNSPMAYSPSSITDIGYMCNKNGYRRTYVVYHNNPYYYPEVAILAYALHVNYAGINTTITTKFKDLFGIPTANVTETELSVLNKKRINTFTLVGNSSRTFREGVDSNNSWFMDDLINLDNFREELQVAVYNVFLKNKKIPYNNEGVLLLRTPMVEICDRYVQNGSFSERPLSEAEKAIQERDTEPPYTIEFTPIGSMTISDRAKRIGPPAKVKVNLAGAIHSIDISVEAYA